LLHIPDLFSEHSPIDKWIEDGTTTKQQAYDQAQLAQVVIADRKACEEGWLLQLAVTHRGRILCGMRTKVMLAMDDVNGWRSLGRGTSYAMDLNEVEGEWYAHGGTNGWNESELS
jgi:hypothetical protein